MDASGLMLAFSWNTWGPSGARYQSSWTHLGPYGGIPQPSRRLREGILKQKQGLEALTWSLHVPRRAHAKIFETVEKQQFLDGSLKQEGQGNMPRWLFGGLVLVFTVILQVARAMLWPTRLPRANMFPSWARLGPILALCRSILGHMCC